jgi:predicted Rossmann-fold nucleotide-binding protein
MSTINSLCVYCGSSSGRLEAYSFAAHSLAEAMAVLASASWESSQIEC